MTNICYMWLCGKLERILTPHRFQRLRPTRAPVPRPAHFPCSRLGTSEGQRMFLVGVVVNLDRMANLRLPTPQHQSLVSCAAGFASALKRSYCIHSTSFELTLFSVDGIHRTPVIIIAAQRISNLQETDPSTRLETERDLSAVILRLSSHLSGPLLFLAFCWSLSLLPKSACSQNG